ncbi:MAG TPA: SRPBCC family protein [Chloroflexota bacterium]|nr:SRPBCC family protein [Chloroflexota bacterium]
MPRVSRTVEIDASPDEVIEYIADVDHHPAFISALNSVHELSGNPRHSETEWSWTFTFAGVALQGNAGTLDYEPGKRYSFQTTGGIQSTFVYEAQANAGGGTVLTASSEYEIPQTVLSSVVDQNDIDRFVQGVADEAAQDLKAIFED